MVTPLLRLLMLIGLVWYSSLVQAGAEVEERKQLVKANQEVTVQASKRLLGHAVILAGQLVTTEAVEGNGNPVRRCRGKDLYSYPVGKTDLEREEVALARVDCIEDLAVERGRLLVKVFANGKSNWFTLSDLTTAGQSLTEAFPGLFGEASLSQARVDGERQAANPRTHLAVHSDLAAVLTQLPLAGDKPSVFFDIFDSRDSKDFKGEAAGPRALPLPTEAGYLINNIAAAGEGEWLVTYADDSNPSVLGKLIRYHIDLNTGNVKVINRYGSNIRSKKIAATVGEGEIAWVIPRLLAKAAHGFLIADQTTWTRDQTGVKRAHVYYFSNDDKKFHLIPALDKSATYLASVQIYEDGILFVENKKVKWIGDKNPFPSEFAVRGLDAAASQLRNGNGGVV